MTVRSVLLPAALVLCLGGCSGPDGRVPTYAAASVLPACGANNSSALAYTEAEDALWVCRGGKGWERVIGESALGKSTVTRVTAEPEGSRCPAGGVRVEVAEDVDRDGTLSEADGTPATSFICNSCTPESDEALCERAAACGQVAAEDNCLQARTVSCLCNALQDEDFLGDPTGAWRASGAAQLAPWAAGGLIRSDGGSVPFQGAALLYPVPMDAPHFGRVEQSFRMGTPGADSPNALEYTVGLTRQPPETTWIAVSGTGGDGGVIPSTGGTQYIYRFAFAPNEYVGVDGRYQLSTTGTREVNSVTTCLGASALEPGRHRLTVATRGGSEGWPEVTVDSARLVQSDSCPAPGSVLDGTFEETTTKWSARTYGSGVAALRTTTDALEGTGSGLLRITNTCMGGTASLGSRVSIPAAGGWRLQMAVTTSGKAQSSYVLLDQVILGRISMATQGSSTFSRCVPAAFADSVRHLSVWLSGTFSFGACTPETSAVTVDNVQLVPDGTCAPSGEALVANGDFEAGMEGWFPGQLNTVTAVTDPALSHGGTGALRLYFSSNCEMSKPSVAALFRAPQAGLPKGAAFRFFYKLDPGFRLKSGGFASQQSGAWTEGMTCAPTQQPGFESGIGFELEKTNCQSILTVPDGGVLLDDVRFTTDPACP